MTNYVIINGVNSNTINGLGINELPPIAKPSMRVLTEEIDGRDGDITTNLGYSAYDKTITIGLFGTGYDIDDIVAFFNGEGIIVFSNEADKYYNYKIINQIDYVALQKFKSASVTFHCQPFKYPLEETPIEIDYDYIEEQDVESATLNTAEATMQVNLLGNTSQTGTPTPSSPIPVNVVSGDNTIVSIGKNLFNEALILNAQNWTKSGEYYTGALGDLRQYFLNNPFYSSYKENTQYTFSMYGYNSSTSNQRMTIHYTDSTITNGAVLQSSPSKVSITSEANKTIDYIEFNFGGNGTIFIKEIMLEQSSSASTYEPYQSNSVLLTLGEYELCKISTYQDRFFKNIPNTADYKSNLEDNEWYLEKKIGKVVLDGSESNWAGGNASTGNTNYTYAYCFGLDNSIGTNRGGYCNKMVSISTPMLAHTYVDTDTICFGDTATARVRMMVLTSRLSSANIAGVKAFLSENPMTCYYILTTPTYTQITGTLKDELEAVHNAKSYKGTTNINQINNDLPFKMNLKAIEDGSNEGIVNNIGNTYAKPIIELEGTGEINIYLNDVQMLKATLTDKMTIDIAKMEAYNPDTSVLLNRQLIGDISKFLLPSGESTIRIDGNLTKATISNYTRWL